MAVIDPEFTEEYFKYSFESINYNYNPPKLKSVKLEKGNFKKIENMFDVLKKLEVQRWSEIPRSDFLYSGAQANQIKEVKEEGVKEVIRNAFSREQDYSDEAKYYPSYLSVTKEVRLFGYQWGGVFKIVLIDLEHAVQKRK